MKLTEIADHMFRVEVEIDKARMGQVMPGVLASGGLESIEAIRDQGFAVIYGSAAVTLAFTVVERGYEELHKRLQRVPCIKCGRMDWVECYTIGRICRTCADREARRGLRDEQK